MRLDRALRRSAGSAPGCPGTSESSETSRHRGGVSRVRRGWTAMGPDLPALGGVGTGIPRNLGVVRDLRVPGGANRVRRGWTAMGPNLPAPGGVGASREGRARRLRPRPDRGPREARTAGLVRCGRGTPSRRRSRRPPFPGSRRVGGVAIVARRGRRGGGVASIPPRGAGSAGQVSWIPGKIVPVRAEPKRFCAAFSSCSPAASPRSPPSPASKSRRHRARRRSPDGGWWT